MAKALLDTDILSEVLKGKDQTVVSHATLYLLAGHRLPTSTITVMEIVKGFHKIGRQDRIRQFMSGLPSLDLYTLDPQSAELAGRIYADLERSGQPIGLADPMIAAIAIHNGLTLVTGNLSHYQRIQSLGYGLGLENWRV